MFHIALAVVSGNCQGKLIPKGSFKGSFQTDVFIKVIA